jgi:Ca2+-binding EF-hand superfamily protein
VRTAVVVLLIVSAAAHAADGPDLLMTLAEKPVRVRQEIVADGPSPETIWNAFLDKLFDYYDRDGDGSLSSAEAARVFPLPLPDRKSVTPNFAGKTSRDEFKAFYRRHGFTPVVVTVVPAAPEIARLNETLFRLLDRDGDGRLTTAELSRAPELLRRLDENEDDALTVAEVLAFPIADPPRVERQVRVVATDSSVPDAVLRIALATSDRMPVLKFLGGKSAESLVTVFPLVVGDRPADFAVTRQFYLAALGNRSVVERKQIDDDASLQLLQPIFDAADRNGDGKLTAEELTAFLALVEAGAACQTFVTIFERGQSLFDLLDANGDGRLDLGELSRAADLLPTGTWTRKDIPARFPISGARGRASGSFGPVSLAARARPKETVATPSARGPRWFQAMDRNGDGFVSASEFIGPPELFRRLDANGDGRISVEEAQKADASKSMRPMP